MLAQKAAILALGILCFATAGAQQRDGVFNDSEELIILLNHKNKNRISAWTEILSHARSVPETERLIIAGISSKNNSLMSVLVGPLRARYAIESNRASDADRERAAKVFDSDPKTAVIHYPRELLERFIVLQYSSVAEARRAQKILEKESGLASVENNRRAGLFSAGASDPYFPIDSPASRYQWGLHRMNFPGAWDITRGAGSYIAVLDAEWPGMTALGEINIHPDLAENFRRHMIVAVPYGTIPLASGGKINHTLHVTGIIAAERNNKNPSISENGTGESNGWIAGACPECSFVSYAFDSFNFTYSHNMVGAHITSAVDTGMQVINWSGGIADTTCPDPTGIATFLCAAINYATQRGTLIVSAAGNSRQIFPQFPGNLGDSYSVLPVGGLSISNTRWDTGATCSTPPCDVGSSYASLLGVIAPAESIVSLFISGTNHIPTPSPLFCGDSSSHDLSQSRYTNGVGDGVGTCSGTSMAAPHISALAGLIRSVIPRAKAGEVRNYIRNASSLALTPNAEVGYGVPDAKLAVETAIAEKNPTRLTPLFSYYSPQRADSLYTINPQMARAAVEGFIMPKINGTTQYQNKYIPTYGYVVTGYSLFQGLFVIGPTDVPLYTYNEAWVFTTDKNEKNNSVPLDVLVRMSWKCGDSVLPSSSICTTNPSHVDTVLVLASEISYFRDTLKYKIDGHEGYIYPRAQPQPPGTVKLLRRYNIALDDHAIFPESSLSGMQSQGYTGITSLDWLGYVYPSNMYGTMPIVQ